MSWWTTVRSRSHERFEIDLAVVPFVGAGERLFGGEPGLTAEDALNAGHQFLNVKRLDDIVVAAGQQTLDALFRLAARGEEEYRQDAALGADFACRS